MRKTIIIIATICFLIVLYSCKKDCNNKTTPILPFIEKYGDFTCGGNLYEYEYIKRHKTQIDSLTDCTFSPPMAFPLDETDMVYIMVGKLSYYSNDTFQTNLYKDTCAKKLTYELSMIQRDTIKVSFYPQGIARGMFCSIENIPADYEVEVKYKYVPLE